jgi:hypothetical protein
VVSLEHLVQLVSRGLREAVELKVTLEVQEPLEDEV